MTKDVSVRRPWYGPSLTTQIMIGLIVGVAVGWIPAGMGEQRLFSPRHFLDLIKRSLVACSFDSVVGIAGGGDLRKVGRMGVKALVYFEVVTTAHYHWPGGRQFNQAGTAVPLVTERMRRSRKLAKLIRRLDRNARARISLERR